MSIEPILNLQDDQMASQFNLVFPKGIPGGGSGKLIELRMNKSIDLPEDASSTYEFWVKGIKVVKPGMNEETEKTLSFEVRVDQNWDVHDQLMTWKKMCHNPNDGTRMPSATTATTIMVQALDGEKKIVKTFKYNYVFCKGVKVSAFDNESSDPTMLTLNLIWNIKSDI